MIATTAETAPVGRSVEDQRTGLVGVSPVANAADVAESSTIHVVVLVVAYNGREFLDDCLRSIGRSDDGIVVKHVVVVDNASKDGTATWVRETFPEVDCVESGENLGFAGGNNLGWEHVQARYANAKYVYLLNQDTLVESGWLAAAVRHLESHDDVACVQSKLLLHPETDRLNSAGNVSHFLGFGFVTAYRAHDDRSLDEVRSIDFPSGAALLVRSETLRDLGLFEPLLFMYLEDVELGWKIHLSGRDVDYLPSSVVFHKYQFKGDYRNYYYLERNRWWLLLAFYRWRTLFLLLPALLLMEAGQCAFAASRGRLRDKLRSYAFFLSPTNLRYVGRRRQAIQRLRRVPDREFVGRFTGRIDFPALQNTAVRWFVNPVFGVYWTIARRLLFW